jgi:hypothetical protein
MGHPNRDVLQVAITNNQNFSFNAIPKVPIYTFANNLSIRIEVHFEFDLVFLIVYINLAHPFSAYLGLVY